MAASAIDAITPGAGLQTVVQTLNNLIVAIGSLNQTVSQIPGFNLSSVSGLSLHQAANDTGAAAAGVPIGGFYVNSSTYALTMRHV